MPIRGFLDLRGADKTILRHCWLYAPATKISRLIRDFKAERNARLLSFQILVNTWSTFEESPLRGGFLRLVPRKVLRHGNPDLPLVFNPATTGAR